MSSKGYGRWTTKKDQWSYTTDVIHTHVHDPKMAEELTTALAEAIGDRLTESGLVALEEFLRSFASAVKR